MSKHKPTSEQVERAKLWDAANRDNYIREVYGAGLSYCEYDRPKMLAAYAEVYAAELDTAMEALCAVYPYLPAAGDDKALADAINQAAILICPWINREEVQREAPAMRKLALEEIPGSMLNDGIAEVEALATGEGMSEADLRNIEEHPGAMPGAITKLATEIRRLQRERDELAAWGEELRKIARLVLDHRAFHLISGQCRVCFGESSTIKHTSICPLGEFERTLSTPPPAALKDLEERVRRETLLWVDKAMPAWSGYGDREKAREDAGNWLRAQASDEMPKGEPKL